MQDAIIDVKTSTLSFITDTIGGGRLLIKGPPTHLPDHVNKFKENNPHSWLEEGFYWSSKQQSTVKDIILTKVNNSDILQSLYFI